MKTPYFRTLATLIILLFSVSFASYSKENANISIPAFFVNQNSIKCGGIDVLILTSCVDHENGLPFCFNQHIVFFDSNKGATSDVNYNHSFDGGNQQFIASIACNKFGKDNYLVITNTNFGNCAMCEWLDVYLEDGKYIGSTQGMSDSRNFTHKPIPKKIENFLFQPTSSKPAASEYTSTDISRSRPRPSRSKAR